MNDEKLLKYSVDYLSKFDSSKKNLSNVLKRKIFKLKIDKNKKIGLLNKIENILSKLEKNKLLDDERYTSSKIIYLSKQGKSKNYIYSYLIKKGIDKSKIQILYETFQKDNNYCELDSAKIFARKKKILVSNDSYEKKLAKMARAGFSYDICKKILN